MRRPSLTLMLATGATYAAGYAVCAAAANRRWGRREDPCGPDGLALPPFVASIAVTGDGSRLAVAVAGPADAERTIVLPHCWAGNRSVWAPVARLLAEHHRVVLYDQRGHADSTVGRAGVDLDALTDDLMVVLEHVDARDAVIAGHSLGGMATQNFMIRHPAVARERVAGLVLAATACADIDKSPARLILCKPVVNSRRLEPGIRNRHIGTAWVRFTVGRRPVLAHLRATGTMWSATPATVRLGLMQAMSEMDLAGHLGAVTVPTTIVVGTWDSLTPPARARRIAAGIPQARLTIIPGAGHMLPLEEPDRLAALIEDMVQATGPTPVGVVDLGAPAGAASAALTPDRPEGAVL